MKKKCRFCDSVVDTPVDHICDELKDHFHTVSMRFFLGDTKWIQKLRDCIVEGYRQRGIVFDPTDENIERHCNWRTREEYEKELTNTTKLL